MDADAAEMIGWIRLDVADGVVVDDELALHQIVNAPDPVGVINAFHRHLRRDEIRVIEEIQDVINASALANGFNLMNRVLEHAERPVKMGCLKN